ncbi:FAD/NAD(P)-binding protein [Lacticaseibacillus hegangensis]|uniref:FAD/NAD(P)-binding protein n=1 Tax=Lacticaseibacillus hegangensis TaxID=2486010 RepID=A0ABW4CVR7_9LACO|nr:FAD/NAD(P)-binding protein [Lacticaseibacillus hegangensis]
MEIALIGAGPRGLLVLERLRAWQQAAETPLTVTLYDPFPIGGRVWRRDQDPHLIMNTAAQHITLFYDRTVEDPGPVMPGPDLAQWAKQDAAAYIGQAGGPNASAMQQAAATLGPNDYPPRALYGYYQSWFYRQMQKRKPQNMTIAFRQATVMAVKPGPPYAVMTEAASENFDGVVMALGTIENTLTREQAALQCFAQAQNRFYLPPGFPAEGDLSTVTHQDVVILRGLGLSFFDFVSRLTEGRGGTFTAEASGGLTYHASGKEPHLLAGSRRGLPYHAKAANEKAPGELWPARFLTGPQLAAWEKAGPLAGDTFWQGLQREVGFVYYSLLLAQRHPHLDLAAFQSAYLQQPEAAVRALHLPAAERLDWDKLTTVPAGELQSAIQNYLAADAKGAERGSKTDPTAAGLEVLRDLRDAVRQVVARGLFSDDEYLDFFLRWFNGTNDFLSIGPPALRIKQLLALSRAGVITFLPRQMTITTQGCYFIAGTKTDPTFKAPGTALIEARVPAANAPTAKDPLLTQLRHDDMATLRELQLAGDRRFQSGAVLVDRDTAQLLDSRHRPQGKLFFWGVPTEGVNWLTTASPRPYVNDVNLRLANRIARQLLK